MLSCTVGSVLVSFVSQGVAMIRIQKKTSCEKNRPRVAFFEMSSCEGCQLQLLNREAGLMQFVNSIDIVHFREGMSRSSLDYDIAFVEGSVGNPEQVRELQGIRRQAKIVVALGTCACFGGVNQLVSRAAVPDSFSGAQPLHELIDVDEKIYGCPVRKQEVENVLSCLLGGRTTVANKYSVCRECRQHNNICLLDQGEPCLGSITRGGCDAWCTSSHIGCWGCRGPASHAHPKQLKRLSRRKNVDLNSLTAKLEMSGGFSYFLARLKDAETGAYDFRKL